MSITLDHYMQQAEAKFDELSKLSKLSSIN